jgi:hypothetical protein
VVSVTLLAQETAGYLFAGVLTFIAAVVVTVAILASSRSDEDETS